MNSIYKIISKNKWIISLYIFILLFTIFYITKLIYDFGDERRATFLIQLFLFSIIFMFSIYFIKDNNKLLLLFSTLTMWFLLEFALYKISPYKSQEEIWGGYSYSPFFKNERMTHYRPRNSFHYNELEEFTMDFKTNNLGFRGENVDENESKVLLIGDSFVEGWGVDDNHTMNILLNKHLDCRSCVVNAGLSSNDLVSAYFYLNRLIKQTSPQLVILNINGTDFNDVLTRYAAANFKRSKAFKFFEFFYGSSFIIRHLTHLFTPLEIGLVLPEEKEQLINYSKKIIYSKLKAYKNVLFYKQIDFFIALQPLRDHFIFINDNALMDELDVF